MINFWLMKVSKAFGFLDDFLEARKCWRSRQSIISQTDVFLTAANGINSSG